MIQERSQHPEVMGTPLLLRMLPTAAEVEEPTTVFCGKELRMGPGRTTTTGEGSMTTVESWHCLTQGSLQLLASGVGPQGGQGWHWLEQDMSVGQRCSWERGQGGSRKRGHMRSSTAANHSGAKAPPGPAYAAQLKAQEPPQLSPSLSLRKTLSPLPSPTRSSSQPWARTAHIS